MPTNRNKRMRKPAPTLSPELEQYLLTGERAKGNVELFRLASSSQAAQDKLREVWELHRDALMAAWVKAYPCSRPWCWWHLEAPEPRRKVGGIGITMPEKYASYLPHFEFGIPASWYAFDHDDPPKFESQAAYLQRLGLLSPAEQRFLIRNPELLDPINLGEE